MKCPYCKGTGKSNMWINGGNVPCTACKGTGNMEVTNEQWIRLCTTEQLAKEIYECVMTHPWHISKEVFLEWLKQPHKEKHNG